MEVEPVRIGAVWPNAGVEVKLATALALRRVLHPRQDRVGVAAAAQRGARDEVVDIEEPPPGEVFTDAKPGDRGGVWVAAFKGCRQAVAKSALRVDLRDEFVGRTDVRAELEQREGCAMRLAGLELTDLGHRRILGGP